MRSGRIIRPAHLAILLAFAFAVAVAPLVAEAAPARMRTEGHTVAASVITDTVVDPDGDIPGAIPATLPITVSDTLHALDAVAPADTEDVYRVWLNQGEQIVATLSVEPTVASNGKPAYAGLELYGPSAVTIDVDWPLAWTDEGESVMRYYALTSGYYYICVWAMPPLPDDPETPEVDPYPGWAGAYTLQSEAIPPAPTSISIARNTSTVRRGHSVLLYGYATPYALRGRYITLKYKRPGSSLWRVLTKRKLYSSAGRAKWSLRKTFSRSARRGYYYFRAYMPVSPGYLGSSSSRYVRVRVR